VLNVTPVWSQSTRGVGTQTVMYEDQTKPRKPSQRQQIQLSLLWNSLTEPYTERVIDLINRMLFKFL